MSCDKYIVMSQDNKNQSKKSKSKCSLCAETNPSLLFINSVKKITYCENCIQNRINVQPPSKRTDIPKTQSDDFTKLIHRSIKPFMDTNLKVYDAVTDDNVLVKYSKLDGDEQLINTVCQEIESRLREKFKDGKSLHSLYAEKLNVSFTHSKKESESENFKNKTLELNILTTA